jgi:atypical dual specificity phosphatase
MSLVATFDISSSSLDDNNNKSKSNKSNNSIRHSIYIGGKIEAKDFTKLITKWKITHILNITPTKQTNIEAGVPNYFESSSKCNLKYKRIPIYDSSISVSELSGKGYENDIVKFISNGLYYGNVFVHCSRGISRSATGIILYLMTKRHMRYSNALALIRQRRPQVQPIPAFDIYLKKRDIELYNNRQQQIKMTEGEGNSKQEDNKEDELDNKKRKRTRTTTTVERPNIGPVLPPSSAAAAAAIRPSVSIGPPIGPVAIEPSSVIGPVIVILTKDDYSSSNNSAAHGDDAGDENSGDTTTTTKKIGPSDGVVVGPELPHSTSSSSSSSSSTDIGPELPPIPTATTTASSTSNDNTKIDIGPCLPPSPGI